MAEDREAQRVLDALEAYLAQVDTARAVRKAFLAGVAVGRHCAAARKLSTGSTGRARAGNTPLGFTPSPLNKPPIPTRPLQDPSPDPDPDPDKSIPCANVRARETLELVAPGEPGPTPLGRAKPKTPWPESLTLTPTLRAYAERQGLNASFEWGKFRDHAHRDDVRHANWVAAWHYWIRNAWEIAARTRHA